MWCNESQDDEGFSRDTTDYRLEALKVNFGERMVILGFNTALMYNHVYGDEHIYMYGKPSIFKIMEEFHTCTQHISNDGNDR